MREDFSNERSEHRTERRLGIRILRKSIPGHEEHMCRAFGGACLCEQ